MRRLLAICGVLAMLAAAAAPAAPRLEWRGPALTRRQAEALAQPALRAPRDSAALSRVLGGVVARLQGMGYLDARAAARWDSAGGPALRLEAVEGRRYRLAALAIDAPAAADSAGLGAGLGLAAGGWASPRALGVAVERALGAVVDRGYAYARLGVSAWDPDSAGVRVRLSGALGPRVTVSAVRIEGLKVTRRAVAERSMGRLSGLPYDRAAAAAARDRLAQLGLFRSVSYAGLEGEGDWSKARLVYRVEEPRYNRFEGAVGVQGDRGTVGLARLELANLLGTGRALALGWESRGRGLADLTARYAEPLLLGAPLRLELALQQQVQDTLFVRTRWGARLQFARSGQERLEAGYEQERVVQERGEVEEASLQNTLFALERDTRDQPIGARRGYRARVSAAQSFKRETLRPPGSRSARAGATEARLEWHRPLRGNAGLMIEAAGAGRFSSQRVLPLFERYPLGGTATLRGFDEEAFRVDRYARSRLEWRWFLGGTPYAALFWDHAWMATRLPRAGGGDRLEVLERDGLGLGLRLEAPGGLVGIDYGLEPGRPPLEGKIHLQLISTF